jgi:pyruvate dehydrogenase E1 component alpha subunit
MKLSKLNICLSKKNHLKIYFQLLNIRLFEEQSIESYRYGKIGGFCHTYIGQESVAVGTFSILKTNDHTITGYRNHAHALLCGLSTESLMAELQGKYAGCSKGKGGSMHFFNKSKNYWGGHGIVGSQIGLATGISFSLK